MWLTTAIDSLCHSSFSKLIFFKHGILMTISFNIHLRPFLTGQKLKTDFGFTRLPVRRTFEWGTEKRILCFVFGRQNRQKKPKMTVLSVFSQFSPIWPLILNSNNRSRWGVPRFGSDSAVPNLGGPQIFSLRNFWVFHQNFLRRIWFFGF